MITFNSKEEFEDAVMEVLKSRLQVRLASDMSYYSERTDSLEIELVDTTDESSFCNSSAIIY